MGLREGLNDLNGVESQGTCGRLLSLEEHVGWVRANGQVNYFRNQDRRTYCGERIYDSQYRTPIYGGLSTAHCVNCLRKMGVIW